MKNKQVRVSPLDVPIPVFIPAAAVPLPNTAAVEAAVKKATGEAQGEKTVKRTAKKKDEAAGQKNKAKKETPPLYKYGRPPKERAEGRVKLTTYVQAAYVVELKVRAARVGCSVADLLDDMLRNELRM